MNYDQRTAAIGRLLRETILPRYNRPDHLDEDTARAEIRDMVEDLNSAWPIMPDSQFESTGKQLARSLRMTYTGRAWPTIAHLAKALKAALAPPPVPQDGSREVTRLDILDIRRAQLEDWCKGNKACLQHLITRANLEVLANDGVIRRNQIDDMLAFAEGNQGVVEDDEPKQIRRNHGGVTIGFKRINT